MRISGVSFFAILFGLANAAPKLQANRKTQQHTSTNTIYQTDLASVSYHGHVPTSTVKNTVFALPVVILSTTHSTTTVTPARITQTHTDLSTVTVSVTAAASTDIISIVSTEYDTTTVTVGQDEVTSTVSTDTTTTVTSTSTVSTSAGFTPIASSIATAVPAKRDLEVFEERSQKQTFNLKNFKYPKSVKCTHEIIVEVIIIEVITGSPVTKILPAKTTTTTVASTVTSTSTIVPADVSTTLTESTTSTITSVSTAPAVTTVVTSTNTVTVSTSTSAFAACATNNIGGTPLGSDFGSLVGEYIWEVEFSSLPGATIKSGNTASAYDCCVSCIADTTCALSIWDIDSSSNKYCTLFDTTTCSASESYVTAYVGSTLSVMEVSNGNCGHAKLGSGSG
ncbi:uncharacterized protein N7529_005877 [Penicillium soppii]|jgi:hypothetical protein|uniref:uncharacterized protein n=1 Tax=Penicillium soppii TaxID=69789 RepID=UPI0025498FA6|nr:uncharacterized protein N7529_005877 [Penicillium soppii]KAJ5863961.1 hypothetical protein N7529_005877 [Penicillium soppii]